MNPEGRPRLVDDAAQRLRALANAEDWQKLAMQSALETAEEARAKVPPNANTLEGEEAAAYLERLVPVVQERILAHHYNYGSVRWFWYLRRAPDELFEGSYGTTLGYDSALAESLSWHQSAVDVSVDPERVRFKTDASAFRHLSHFVGRVKFLSQLHALYRRIGKGALLDASSPILCANTNDVVENAIHLYDTRHDYSHEFVGSGLGISSIPADVAACNEIVEEDNSTLFMSSRCSPIWVPARYPDEHGEIITVDVEARHFFESTTLNRILDPFGQDQGIESSPPYLSAIAPIVQLLMIIPVLYVHAPWAMSSTLQLGYFFVSTERLKLLFDYHLPRQAATLRAMAPSAPWANNYDAWRQALDAIVPSLWPQRSGGVLRKYGTNTLIDTTTASNALLQHLELDRSPLSGNVRASTFELQCQKIIDDTGWRPNPELSEYKGRTLRRNGITLTDVDALGERGKKLILVSCKSLIYDRDYDKGTYRVVRNAQSTIDQAVVDWDDIVTDIRNAPKGDNFDFSSFTEIVGVVCSPFVVYSSSEKTLATVSDGLRAYVSSLELRDWLMRNPIQS